MKNLEPRLQATREHIRSHEFRSTKPQTSRAHVPSSNRKAAVAVVLALSHLGFDSAARAAGFQGLDRLGVSASGAASEDRRVDTKTFGIKTGCKGDTVEASIQFTRMTTVFHVDGVVVVLSYAGEYTRQGWAEPCTRVPALLNGVEYRKVAGQYSFKLRMSADGNPIVDEVFVKTLGPLSDPLHDANVQAVRAVRSAVTILPVPK